MSEFKTVFGSLENYEKGHIEIIDDDPKAYAFSNIFEVANQSAPYEKVVVGKNLKYVIETLRTEGDSDWYTCAHDEFVVCMEGSVKLKSDPDGPKMGRIILRHGHQALLPKGSAYRFSNRKKPGVLIMQTICGDHSVEKWAEICYS
jgi:homogentisate 1,2-dioxygenase